MSKKSKKKRPAYRDDTYGLPQKRKQRWIKHPCKDYPVCREEKRGNDDCDRGKLPCCKWKI
jgi:hypothetical protein